MDASKSFDAYEVIGVITPGSVVALMLALQWPEFRTLLGQEGLSVGRLGVFVVAAFVLGHLVQGIGNILDNLFWALRHAHHFGGRLSVQLGRGDLVPPLHPGGSLAVVACHLTADRAPDPFTGPQPNLEYETAWLTKFLPRS